MIFVTVGAQMPFDRLIKTVDKWALMQPEANIKAQIGTTTFRPSNLEWTEFMSPSEFRLHVDHARIIVAHAGMGSILTAMQWGKPILIMPRRGKLMETRNDHQVATAKRFSEVPGITVAMDENELLHLLDSIDSLSGSDPIQECASDQLLSAVRRFVSEYE